VTSPHRGTNWVTKSFSCASRFTGGGVETRYLIRATAADDAFIVW